MANFLAGFIKGAAETVNERFEETERQRTVLQAQEAAEFRNQLHGWKQRNATKRANVAKLQQIASQTNQDARTILAAAQANGFDVSKTLEYLKTTFREPTEDFSAAQATRQIGTLLGGDEPKPEFVSSVAPKREGLGGAFLDVFNPRVFATPQELDPTTSTPAQISAGTQQSVAQGPAPTGRTGASAVADAPAFSGFRVNPDLRTRVGREDVQAINNFIESSTDFQDIRVPEGAFLTPEHASFNDSMSSLRGLAVYLAELEMSANPNATFTTAIQKAINTLRPVRNSDTFTTTAQHLSGAKEITPGGKLTKRGADGTNDASVWDTAASIFYSTVTEGPMFDTAANAFSSVLDESAIIELREGAVRTTMNSLVNSPQYLQSTKPQQADLKRKFLGRMSPQARVIAKQLSSRSSEEVKARVDAEIAAGERTGVVSRDGVVRRADPLTREILDTSELIPGEGPKLPFTEEELEEPNARRTPAEMLNELGGDMLELVGLDRDALRDDTLLDILVKPEFRNLDAEGKANFLREGAGLPRRGGSLLSPRQEEPEEIIGGVSEDDVEGSAGDDVINNPLVERIRRMFTIFPEDSNDDLADDIREVEEAVGNDLDNERVVDLAIFRKLWSTLYQTTDDPEKKARFINDQALSLPDEIQSVISPAVEVFSGDNGIKNDGVMSALLETTAKHESDAGRFILPLKKGNPARGAWQVEPATAKSLVETSGLFGPKAEALIGKTSKEIKDMSTEELQGFLLDHQVNAVFATAKYVQALKDRDNKNKGIIKAFNLI